MWVNKMVAVAKKKRCRLTVYKYIFLGNKYTKMYFSTYKQNPIPIFGKILNLELHRVHSKALQLHVLVKW